MAVIQVGVRDLRQRLSHYLDIARSGQSIAITEHGKVIAQLVPAGTDVEERLRALQAAGLIRWSGGKLAVREPVARLRGEKQVSELVSEMRE
jgi:prevent-host-death family protein